MVGNASFVVEAAQSHVAQRYRQPLPDLLCVIDEAGNTPSTVAAGFRRSVGDSTIHRRLLPAEVLRQARPGQAPLLHGTLPPAHLTGRRAWLEDRLASFARGGPDPGVYEVPRDLQAALDYDPTPPLEVLAHLPGYSGPRKGASPSPGTDEEVVETETALRPATLGEMARRREPPMGIER